MYFLWNSVSTDNQIFSQLLSTCIVCGCILDPLLDHLDETIIQTSVDMRFTSSYIIEHLTAYKVLNFPWDISSSRNSLWQFLSNSCAHFRREWNSVANPNELCQFKTSLETFLPSFLVLCLGTKTFSQLKIMHSRQKM